MKFENIKYGADTSPWWNQAPGYRWKTTSSGNTAYTYAPAMPNGNLTVYGQTLSSSYKYTIHYYEEGTTNKVHEDNVYYRSDNGYHLTEEDYIAIPGFVCLASGSTYPDNNLVYTIYYRRQSYNLSFKNGSETKDGGTHLYQADISDTYYVPTYTGDDADAYTFGGWYTTEKYIDGTKFDFEKNTMPYNNLILYAKWVPVTHTVTFYLEEKKIEEGEVLNTTTVAHGAKVDPVPSTPTNGDYSFVGWFYKEDGVEKAFDFANMPVNKDLVVYGKWSSNVLKKYTVYYKTEIKNADGTVTVKEIADPTTGSERAGATKTFDAKGGEDLYEGYQVGYFPMVKSHSLKIDIEADETGIDGQDKNTYTFWYVQKDAVPYTVKYLDAETGNPVEKEKVVTDNRMAVVTENFVVVPGYMPDAYQKRLVIDITDGAVNEIIFKYTKDIEHAYYKITHYIQNLDGETWTEYTSSQEIGEIEKYYTDSPMTISGYTYDSIEYKVADSIVPDDQITEDGAKLTADGLEINLYYIRNRYPYQVRYLKEGTTDPLADPENGTELYGEVIYREPISIQYYEPVDSKGQSLNIRIEKETDADGNIIAKLNVITFYYKEKEVKINYEVVGPAGCGTVDTESETLKVLSGEAKGSTATAANNAYKFVGWYSDAACTEANRLSTDAKYVPTKADEEAWVDGTTFYAKFDWNLADLTISKSGLNHTTGDDRESAIFVVTDSENKEIATVAIPGNGSVVIGGLTVGQTYTVTELNSWTWRYTPDSAKKTVTIKPPTEETKVTFINSQTNNSWLGGDNYEINKFN